MLNEFPEDLVYAILPRIKKIQFDLISGKDVAAMVELKVIQSELEVIKNKIDNEYENRATLFAFANCVDLGIGVGGNQ